MRRETTPEYRDALSRDWSRYLRSLFHDAIIIPLLSRPDMVIATMKTLDINRVIFSNGGDWGEDKSRDATEKKLFVYCVKQKIPVLGVCRGFQVINILCGGGLQNDIRKKTGRNHRGVIHEIEILNKTHFAKFSRRNIIKVNSYHNQGILVSDIAPRLRIFAKTNDGVVEGLYHPTQRIVGIEWHPERKNPSADFDKKIITNLFKK